MTYYSLLSPAKINLALHVTGQREDGYHLLESFIVFAPWGDELLIKESDKNELIVSGDYAGQTPTDEKNLIWKAYHFLEQEYQLTLPKFQIALKKNIPTGAGLGGGSSNAARLLKFWHNLYASHIPFDILIKTSVKIGADIPVCIYGKNAIVKNIGDDITPLPRMGQKYYCLLVKPKNSLETKLIFQTLDNKNNPPLDNQNPDEILSTGRNDLETPAKKILPIIGEIIIILSKYAVKSAMSGSGSACFGLFHAKDDLQKARKELSLLGEELFYAETFILL